MYYRNMETDHSSTIVFIEHVQGMENTEVRQTGVASSLNLLRRCLQGPSQVHMHCNIALHLSLKSSPGMNSKRQGL